MINASRLSKMIASISTIQLSVFFAARGGMLVEQSNTLFKNAAIETDIILTGLGGIGLVLAALVCATMASFVLQDIA